MKASFKLYTLLIAISLALGILASLTFQDWNKPTLGQQPQITIPHEGVKTNELAIIMLNELAKSADTNPVCSPFALESILFHLQELAAGENQKLFDKLPLGNEKNNLKWGTPPKGIISVIVDEAQARTRLKAAQEVLTLPLSQNMALSEETLSSWVKDDCGLHGFGSCGVLNNGSPMLGLSIIHFNRELLYPITSSDLYQDFFTPNGRAGFAISFTKQSAYFRVVEHDDCTAIALFFKAVLPQNEPTCLMLIVPRGDLRPYAAAMTQEKMNKIRQALAQAEPRAYRISFPLFTETVRPRSMRSIIAGMGAEAIFDQGADYSGLFTESQGQALKDIIIACSLDLSPQDTASTGLEEYKNCCVNTPFIWVIGDLSLPSAPIMMGLFE